MLANVEIKARVRELAGLVSSAERLSGSPGQVLVQMDVFFTVSRGRLKLRRFGDGRAQLIFYDCPDSEGPKLSQYIIWPTSDLAGLGAVLSHALRVQDMVKKERRAYTLGQTCVHVDHVKGLGDFMELKVVLQEQQKPQDGKQVAWQLMEELEVREEDLLPRAYLDLLLAGGEPQLPS